MIIHFTDLCSEGYENLFSDSKYCFKNVNKKQLFGAGREECEKDGGDLATFWTEEERKYFQTSKYDGFRFGYRRFRKDKGKFLNASFYDSTYNQNF